MTSELAELNIAARQVETPMTNLVDALIDYIEAITNARDDSE